MPNEERWRWERERGRNAPRDYGPDYGYGGYTGQGYGGVGAGGGYASTGRGYVAQGYGGYGQGSVAQGGGGYGGQGYSRADFEPDADDYGPDGYPAGYDRPDQLADPRGSYGPRDYRRYEYGGYRYTGRGYEGRDD